MWKNSINVTITTPTTPRTVTTPTIPLDLIDALCIMLPTLAVEPERKAAIIQVSKKNPTTMATTSSMSGFASPIPSIGLEPDVKGSVAKNLAPLQNQKKPSQLGNLIIFIKKKMTHKSENYSVKMQKY
jgi:hypothetical protein